MGSINTTRNDFNFPRVHHHEQRKVEAAFEQGKLDYVDLSQWSFADELLCFALQNDFLKFAGKSYPNPRSKNEVPVWFLIASQLVLRTHNSGTYSQLDYFLNAGSILTKVGFNLSGSGQVGFNNKNAKPRKTAVNHDTVRKYFKDTDPKEVRNWFNRDIQDWFRIRKTYDKNGLFILDQSHLVVPKNNKYKDAVYMPVDEHGQRYKNLGQLSEDQKKSLPYHPCYTLSCLLHIDSSSELFHVASYELGPGNEDELPQAERLVFDFCKRYPGVMQELIVDRGYLSGPFIGRLKKEYGVDILIPLRRNMDDYIDAFEIAKKKTWKKTEEVKDKRGRVTRETKSAYVEGMDLWDECPTKLNVCVSQTRRWSASKSQFEEYSWALASTKEKSSAKKMIRHYGLRFQVEERFRQFKKSWNIGKFPSTTPGLIESHVCFILLTYSLLQLYLRRKDLKDVTRQTIETIRREESLGRNAVIVYYEGGFAIFDLNDCLLKTISMPSESQRKRGSVLEKQKEVLAQRFYS